MTAAYRGVRFCANSGASIPQAWEFAWCAEGSAVTRIAVPVAPLPVDARAWPQTPDMTAQVRLASTVQCRETPVGFAWDSDGPRTALYLPSHQRLVELPSRVAELLRSGVAVPDLMAEWTVDEEPTGAPTRAVALARFGFIVGHGLSPRPPRPGRSWCVQEPWTVSAEHRKGHAVLSSTVTGTLLRPGAAAAALWERCREGVPLDSVSAQERSALDALAAGGLTRWTERPGRDIETP